MRRSLIAFVAGALFGAGLLVSQMTNPAKVVAFLDIFGNWDPSLAFVMGPALLVTFFGYRIVLRNEVPKTDIKFHLPASGGPNIIYFLVGMLGAIVGFRLFSRKSPG